MSTINSISSLYNSLFSSNTTSSLSSSDILKALTGTESDASTSTGKVTGVSADSSSNSAMSSLLDLLNESSSSSTSSLINSLFGSAGGGSDTTANLISSMFSSSAEEDSLFSLASQYNSLKNSQALVKAYYKALQANIDVSSGGTDSVATALESASKALISSANALTATGTNSLFKTDDKGNYDMDAIVSAVSNFVEKYNATVESASDSSNNSILTYEGKMISETKSNASLLGKVGITINEDGTLSVDKDTLKKADAANIKTLFNGSTSYAANVSNSASQINIIADIEASFTYSGSGSAANSSVLGSLLDSLI